MTLNAGKIKGGNGGKRVEQPALEDGAYPARVVQIIDLGLQPQRPYQGEDKPPADEIMVTYELVDEFLVDEKGEIQEDKPRWVSETFPLRSLDSDLAKSTKRYKVLDRDMVYGGDWSMLLGSPCNVNIVVNVKGDKTYTNVSSIAAMRPKELKALPELANEPKMFTLDGPNMEVFLSLPEWLQTKIKGNLRYNGSALQELIEGDKPKPKPKAKEEPEEEDDDLPFEPDNTEEDDDDNW